MKARSVSVLITYDNKDISKDIAAFLKSFSFSDAMSNEADSIDITLEDRTELWEGDWLPDKGAIITASIVTHNWDGEGDERLDLGKFELDEIELSGPEHSVTLKGVSIPNNNELRGVEKSRSWEKVKFSKIAQDIAADAKMELFYDIDEGKDPDIDRAEQTDQSDLEFLMKLCKDHGMALKVTDEKLVIFDELKYEEADPVDIIKKGSHRMTGWSLKSKLRETYKSCHVVYKESKSGQVIEATFTAPDKTNKEGKILTVNTQVKSIAEAEELAKKKLREKNAEEVTVSLSLVGSIGLMAGSTVMLEGFHAFDGKYLITKGSHSIGGGYGLSLELRRCLNGY